MCKIPASHYLASDSKKMTYGHELSLNLTHQNRAKINKTEWRTHVDHELTFCTLHFCPEHMFLQLISLGICDGAFSCVCFLCVGILGKELLLWEKKQFLLLCGHGPNKDCNWTFNHRLAAKPVWIRSMARVDLSVLWGKFYPEHFVLFCSVSFLHLNHCRLSFPSLISESPSVDLKHNLMSQQQLSLSFASASEMWGVSCTGQKGGKTCPWVKPLAIWIYPTVWCLAVVFKSLCWEGLSIAQILVRCFLLKTP